MQKPILESKETPRYRYNGRRLVDDLGKGVRMCVACHQTKPLVAFRPDASRLGGVGGRCWACEPPARQPGGKCAHCEAVFSNRLRGGRPQRFCSRVCKDKSDRKIHYIRYKATIDAARASFVRRKIARWEACMAGKVCSVCGDARRQVLQHHHVNPSQKSFNLGEGASRYKWEVIMEEAKKCVILCANCHKMEESAIRAARRAKA